MTTKSPTDAAAAIEVEPLAYRALLRENVIKVEIGPNHTEYYVHPRLLFHYSEYFKRALNGSWKEAEDWVIMLEDVECQTFEIFLEWLYSQQYPKDHRFGSANQNRTKRLGRVKACAFGDRLMAPAFRAASESALIDDLVLKGGTPFYELIIYAYGNLPSDSPVLHALVDAHCYGFTETADTDKNGELVRRSELPQAFLVEVMVRYMRLQPAMSSRKRLDRCDYHGHAPEERKGQSCQVPRIDDFKGDLSKKF